MDGRGGCCIARYGGGGASVYDVSKMDQIMLRFRPIAPKPAASGAVSGGSKAAESDNKTLRTGRGRKRRRNSNSNPKENSKSKSTSSSGSGENSGGNKRCRKRKSGVQEGNTEKLSDKSGVQDNAVVTLPLLPETPDLTATMKGQKAPVMLSFDGSGGNSGQRYGYPAVRGSEGGTWKPQKRVVGSWVIVERVTSTWAEEEGMVMMLGRMSDEEKRRVLEEDTCPGFVTDCWSRVWWTNKAYKKMAREKGGGKEAEAASLEEEVVVWLVMKEKLPVNCEGFTCRVTVQSTWSQPSSTVTVPCDVWRLSDGGFAWRLDFKAALSLGR